MAVKKKGAIIPPAFALALKAAKLPLPAVEYAFALEEGRKFRWDFAWHTYWQVLGNAGEVQQRPGVALEVQGGIWSRGAHGRGTGITRDMEKFSLGAALGWRLLLVEPKRLHHPETIELIRRALAV